MARSATVEEEQVEMFEEIDPSKPKEKALLAAAKKYAKAEAARKLMMKDNKEKVDVLRDKVRDHMHECGMTKVKYRGVIIELNTPEELVSVTMDDPDEEAETDPDD